MNVVKDEVLDVKSLSKKYNVKEKVLENMIIICENYNCIKKEIKLLVDEYYLLK